VLGGRVKVQGVIDSNGGGEALLWWELEHSSQHFRSMPDIEFISTPYCPMFQCMKMENHSNLPASTVEGRWRSAETFALAMR
jgi:hypothetical protein